MDNNTGIYRIVCNINNRSYVGSAVDLRKRKREHFSALRSNRHFNKHLQNAYNKHGEHCFDFKVVKFCEPEMLLIEEEKQIKIYNSFNDGFNLVETPTTNMLGINTQKKV